VKFLVNKKLATANTYTAENIQNKREELDIIDRARKTKVAKMTRAVMIRLPTAAACFSII
jgi:hypothetical protein